eukprot:TRINITY_DN24880_c0_g1_i1.p1 TRINITY_DN24880_c0_g1~~TRINITY_DN24880_c0_g1_i1.p1  ORF type:complete len:309 (+),score=31.72 TRINITY_DN24880_c0_g1_i1:115-1041(+)
MSTWTEFIWGKSESAANTTADIENLPEYDTFNGLAPKFQVGPELDPNHIFEEELALVEEVRKLVPESVNYPSRYILIFLFARRHSVPHSVKLLTKHLRWLKSLGLPEVTNESPYPFTPDQLTTEERHWAISEGPLIYRHALYDKRGRLLQFVRPRNWIKGRISLNRYVSTVVWWYYYSFRHVPLAVHRNGISVVIDMKDMGWASLDFSSEMQQFITTATSCLPGRMRQSWIVNANWILNTAWSLLKLIMSEKLLARMQVFEISNLSDEIEKQYILKDLGGDWEPNLMVEWYEKVFELDQLLKESKKEI